MNLPRRELVQTIGEGEGQLKRFLLRALLWAIFRRIYEGRHRRRPPYRYTDHRRRCSDHLCAGGRLCRIRCGLLSDHGRSSSLHRGR
nr:MAG TPA: hypothetical protein [Caudoviricetes sp.]